MSAAESRRFTRRVEDFDCLRCGAHVEGDGYTNHCPCCLWSRHVDVNPGDRKADCGGQMEPVAAVYEGAVWWLRHRCVECDFERRIRAADADDLDLLIEVSLTPK